MNAKGFGFNEEYRVCILLEKMDLTLETRVA